MIWLGSSWPYLIFVIFSPRVQFLAQFFSTQNHVNRTKTDFATKQRNLQKNWFCNKTLQNAAKYHKLYTLFLHISDFLNIYHMWRIFSTWQSVMWRISPPDNLSCGQISPHDRFFSTGTARGARDKYEVCVNQYVIAGFRKNHMLIFDLAKNVGKNSFSSSQRRNCGEYLIPNLLYITLA